MIKVILFDLWNTLMYNDSDVRPADELMEIFKELGSEEPADTLDKILNQKEFLDEKQAAQSICKQTGCDPERVESILLGYNKIRPTPFPDTLQALNRLRKSYKIVLVSNVGTFNLRITKATGFFNLFHRTFFSCQIGMLKQNPDLFRYVIKEMGIEPEEAIMVGDCKFADIDPAEKVGIKSVLIKREGFPLNYNEKESFHRTIKNLDELDKYLTH
jgi:HAD superfamily hydrolase (TIGR01549 family)